MMERNPNKPRVLYLYFMKVNNNVKTQHSGGTTLPYKAWDVFKTPHVQNRLCSSSSQSLSDLTFNVTETPQIPTVLEPEFNYTERKLHSCMFLFLYTGTNKVLIVFDFQSESLWHEVH